MQRPITIQEVAVLAQVSPSTVSNALNGRTERMRPETLGRVKSAIEQLGYSPNRTARNLKTGHTEIIGVIVPSVANPFHGTFASLIEQEALKHGYQVLLGNSQRDPERERRYAEELWSYGIRGLIFGSSLLALTHLAEFADRGMHIVAFDRQGQPGDTIRADNISMDNVSAGHVATRHLLDLGHRRIGFLSGPIGTVNRLNRLQGYRNALREAGVEPDASLVWEKALRHDYGDTEGIELGRRGARELLSQPDPPTALVAINDMWALGAYAGARDLGLRIPDEISVVGIDDIVLAEVVSPPLTTIHQPLREMSQAAVELVIARIEHRTDAPPQHITQPPQLIERRSTAPPGGNRSGTGRKPQDQSGFAFLGR